KYTQRLTNYFTTAVSKVYKHIKHKEMKKYHVYFWIATTVIFLFEGLMPISTLIFSPENFNAGTSPLGYPDYFAYALIICKFLGASVIIIPNIPPVIKEWAYAGL